MTNFLLLIGAGLFSKAVGAFEKNAFNNLLGADVDDAGGDGPGSYRVKGNVWHLDCCNPDNKLDGQGWSIFGAIFGWSNSATRKLSLDIFKWSKLMIHFHRCSGNRAFVCVLLDRRYCLLGVPQVQGGEQVCIRLLDVCSLYVQGRTTILGRESAAGARRRQARAVQGVESDESSKKGSVADESHAVEGGIGELPR